MEVCFVISESCLMSGVAGKKVLLNPRHLSENADKNKGEEDKSKMKFVYPPNPQV